MKIDHIDGNQLKSQIRATVGKHIDLANYKLFLFGSRVRGNNSSRSDIDLGIEGKTKLPASVKIAIEDDLEKLPTFYKLDFVDLRNVPNSFKREVMKSAEIIA